MFSYLIHSLNCQAGRHSTGFSPQSSPHTLEEGLGHSRSSTKSVLGMAENSFLTLGLRFLICSVKPLGATFGVTLDSASERGFSGHRRYREDLQLALNILETIFYVHIKRDLLLILQPYVHLRCNPFTFTNKETEAQSVKGTVPQVWKAKQIQRPRL